MQIQTHTLYIWVILSKRVVFQVFIKISNCFITLGDGTNALYPSQFRILFHRNSENIVICNTLNINIIPPPIIIHIMPHVIFLVETGHIPPKMDIIAFQPIVFLPP